MSERSEDQNDSPLTTELQIFSKKLSLVVALVGFLVILGWVFDIAALKGILPKLPTIKVNMALCFLLGGVSLWLWHWKLKITSLDYHRRQAELALQQTTALLQQELRTRQQAEEALHVSQARFAGILEIASDAIISVDVHQRITLFNQGAEKVFGYTASEILGQPLDLLLPNRLAVAHRQHISNFSESAGIARRMGERSEIFGRRKDGSEFPAEASISKLEIGGETVFTALVRDITERKQAREGLLKLAAMVESSDDAIISKSLDGIILSWNTGAQRIFGYTASEVVGRPISILAPPDRRDEAPQILQKIQQGESVYHYETVRVRKDGQRIYISTTVSPIRDQAGTVVGASAIKRDITDQKQAEKALRESEERFREIAGTISQCFFVRSASSGQFLYVSPAYERIWGRTCQNLYQDPQSWMEALHPDERHLVQESLREQFCGNPVKREYRIIRPDSQERWIVVDISVVRDEAGQALRFIGVAEDITSRKQVEKALQQSEARYLAILEDQTDLITRFLPDGTLTFVNEAFCRYFGLKREQIIGKRYEPVIFEEDREHVAQLINSINLENPVVIIENRVIVQGEVRWTQWINRAVFDQQGCLVELQSVGRDISDRKQAEVALRERQRQLEAIASNIPKGSIHRAIFHVDGRMSMPYISPSTQEITELTSQEVMAHPELLLEMTHPDDQAAFEQNLRTALETLQPTHFDFRMITASGQVKWVQNNSSFHRLENGDVVSEGVVLDITDRKQAELEVIRSRDLREAIFNESTDALFLVDAQTTLTLDCNLRAVELFEASGKYELIGTEGQTLQKRQFTPEELAAIVQEINTRGFWSRELEYVTKTGNTFWGNLAAKRITVAGKEMNLVRVTDVSDRKRAEESLQRYERIVSATTDSICLIDRNYTYQIVNQAYLTLHHKRLDEIIGHSVKEILGADRFETLMKPRLDQCLAGESVNYQMWLDYPTTGRQFIGITYAPYFEANNTISGIVVSVRNLTDLKQAELELQRAKEAAEVANRAKSIFLANMSHELRTPLNVILGFTQVMTRDSLLTKEQRENLQIISKSGNHLLALINDVLDLSKIEAGRITLDESSFDLIAQVRALQKMLGQKAEAKGLQLSQEIAPDVPQYISADPNKLRQVLINLLSNAIKFTQKGRVTLRVGMGSREMEERSKNAPPSPPSPCTLHFEVADTGVGIAPTELDTIFDAFAQSQAGKVSPEGTGLGLTISRKFVRLMGGDISVSSIFGQGSRFRFEIPVRLALASEVQPNQTHRQVIGLAPGQPPYRILIADDQPENRQLLVKLLTQLGLEVREAQNGAEAVTLWQQWQPHLIWMDIQMPLMNGYEATKKIRSSVEGQSAVIIALTAHASKSDRTVSLEAGCNDFVSKPFQEQTLFAKMAEYLGLQYVYAESDQPSAASHQLDEQTQPDVLTPESLSVMPRAWIQKLHEAAQLCDDEEIFHLIEQIPPEHASLIDHLSRLARDFHFQPIVQLSRSIQKNTI